MEAMTVTKFGTKDEDSAQTSNTCIAHRRHTILHSMMKNNRNIIECCSNSHQETPCTGKQMIRTHIREN